MAVATIDDSKVTIPDEVLIKSGLRQGSRVNVTPLSGGGVGIFEVPAANPHKGESLWDIATKIAKGVPGLDDVEFELPQRRTQTREVEW